MPDPNSGSEVYFDDPGDAGGVSRDEEYFYDTGESTGTPVAYTTKTCKLIIYYNANGASGNPPATQKAIYSGAYKEVTLDLTVAKDTDGSMTYSGYVFLGWATSSGSTQISYDAGDVITKTWASGSSGTNEYTLYAIWSNEGRIVYRSDEYANEQGYEKYAAKPLNQVTALRGAIFTRTGYTQIGWRLEDGTYFGDVDSPYTFTSNDEVVLYPEWQVNTYTITYKSNGTNEQDIIVPVAYDSIVTIAGSLTYHKGGYHISVWNENEDLLGTAWFPGKNYKYTRTSNLILYAVWAGNEYYVVYDTSNAGISSVSEIIDYPLFDLDQNGVIISLSESSPILLDSDDIIYTNESSYLIAGENDSAEYSIATYGSVFYTDYRPGLKDGYIFDGWETVDGHRLVKSDYAMDAYSFNSNAIWNLEQDVILRPIWTARWPSGKIFFGRKESLDYGIVVENPPDYYWPERKNTHNSIKGRNGDILYDPERYENATKTYSVAVHTGVNFVDASKNLSEFLHRYDGYADYIRLEDSFEPDVYMMGIYEESNSVNNILDMAGKTKIAFNCKPQKFLLSGDRRIDIMTSGYTIINPTDHPALPKIEILGYGEIQFVGYPDKRILGDFAEQKQVDLIIHKNYNVIKIDCETFDIVNASGGNMSNNVTLLRRIFLYPGENTITWSGNIQKISIIPRWWRV